MLNNSDGDLAKYPVEFFSDLSFSSHCTSPLAKSGINQYLYVLLMNLRFKNWNVWTSNIRTRN